MSRKLSFIPPIPNYEWVRNQMQEDLKYRLETRKEKTSLGRPLYYRINVQIVMTQECPNNCAFCVEKIKPMKGCFQADAQKESLKQILKEHPNARLTITGGEPSLYPEHVKELVEIYKENSNQTFVTINTSGYDTAINNIAHINLSVNDYVKPDPEQFPGATIQTVLTDEKMNLDFIKKYMSNYPGHAYSFRYLSDFNKHDYAINVFNELQNDPEITVRTFRIGDFFVYATFDYRNTHARITLGDLYQQTHNDYQDGYSNIVIHPDGRIAINWN